ncbi:amino acid racemase [Boseongicola sp. H5]|uniref:aspartate/glutamate racemase family protein n=1 Tax=Boseongicola sp. H5 TaxID=2763261 RepID=UPI00336A03F9
MMRRVGILGGMGPQATVLLMQKVLAAVPASDDADHVPLIVDQNPQVPSRIRRLIEGTGDDPAPVLAEMAQRLEAAGAEALAMPCNTAHHYADAIRSATSVPFLDMVVLSAGHAATLSGRGARVGILASPALRKVALFDAAFALEDLTPIYPEDDDAMLAAIRRIKAEGVNAASRAVLAAASAEVLAQGAVVQIIACTEFSLIPDAVAPGATVFDSLDRLVAELVAFATSPAGREGMTGEPSHAGLQSAAVPDRAGPV